MNKKAFLMKQVSVIIECKTPVNYKDRDVLQSQLISEALV